MKKRIILIALAAAAAAGLIGCSKKVSYDFDVSEYVELDGYKGIEISQTDIESKVEESVESIKSSYTTSEEVKDEIKKDDVVTVKYSLKVGDEEIEKQENYSMTVGKETKEFDGELIGHKTEDTLKYTFTLPEDYSKKDYAGKEATYEVTVGTVKRSNVPEIDDAFVKEKYEGLYDSVDELMAQLRSNAKQSMLWEDIMARVIFNKFPERNIKIYYDNYVNYYTNMYASYASQLNTSLASVMEMFGTDYKTIYDNAAKAATNDVKNELVSLYIAEKEGITISDEYYAEKIEELYPDYGYESASAMEKAIGKDAINRMMINELVLNLVEEAAVEKAPEKA